MHPCTQGFRRVCAYLQVMSFTGQALQTKVELLGDGGYQGVAKQHAKSKTPYKRWRGRALTAEQSQETKALSKRRIVVEHVLRRLKVFRVFKGV